MPGISELRIKFDNMTTAQKKQFCVNLRKQVENSKNAEHKKFLNECVQKYNAEFQAGQQNGGTVNRQTRTHSTGNYDDQMRSATNTSGDSEDISYTVTIKKAGIPSLVIRVCAIALCLAFFVLPLN